MKIEITKGGDFKCLLEILEDGSANLLGAIDGWGDSCVNDVKIEVTELPNELKERVEELEEAISEFCERVDKGEVRSKRTYSKFKSLINRGK